MRFDIITIGAATMDIFLRSKDFSVEKIGKYSFRQAECVPLGSKIEIRDVTFESGGGGTNTAVSFARKGLKTATLVRVGFDAWGKDILQSLHKEKVSTAFVEEDKKEKTGFSIILVAPTGERSILTHRGASEKFLSSQIPWHNFQAEWFYISSLGGNIKLLEDLVNFAKIHNIHIALNPGSRELAYGYKKFSNLLKNISILIMNEEEMVSFTGVSLHHHKDIVKKIRNFTDAIIVMTQGPEGVMILDGYKLYQAGIFKEKEIVDRTGAGDAFGSGFLAGYLLSHRDIKEAIRIASANSTSVLEHVGAKAGLLTLKDLMHYRWKHIEIKESLI